MKWMEDNGTYCGNIKIRQYAKNFRGVHAARDIRSGQRIMTIPEKLILTESKAWAKSPLGAKIKASGVTIDYPYCTYIGCLLLDAKKDEKHEFRPYYDMFPTDSSAFPLCYNEEEQGLLSEISIAGSFSWPLLL